LAARRSVTERRNESALADLGAGVFGVFHHLLGFLFLHFGGDLVAGLVASQAAARGVLIEETVRLDVLPRQIVAAAADRGQADRQRSERRLATAISDRQSSDSTRTDEQPIERGGHERPFFESGQNSMEPESIRANKGRIINAKRCFLQARFSAKT